MSDGLVIMLFALLIVSMLNLFGMTLMFYLVYTFLKVLNKEWTDGEEQRVELKGSK